MAGIFGIFNHNEASNFAYLGCYAMQQRGTKQSGIVSSDENKLYSFHSQGLIKKSVSEETIRRLKGKHAIAQIDHKSGLALPYKFKHASVGEIAVCLDSNQNQPVSLFSLLGNNELESLILSSLQYLDFSSEETLRMSLNGVNKTFIALNKNKMLVSRDPWGNRPLILGKLGKSILVSTESISFDLLGAEIIREVEPGEVILITDTSFISLLKRPSENLLKCSFEHVYFSRPDSIIFDQSVNKSRHKWGKILAKEHPVEKDCITLGVPDSGVPVAVGFSQGSNTNYLNGIIRNRYVGKMESNATLSPSRVRTKFNVDRSLIEGQKVALLDDSLLGGEVARLLVQMLKDAGAIEVHVRIACPPILSTCQFGQGISNQGVLIAKTHSFGEILKHLKADSLGFLSMESFLSVFHSKQNFCTECMRRS